MAFNKFLGSVALGLVLLLDQTDACSCIPGQRDLCDFVDAADVVVRATALSRSEQENINDEVTYTINTRTLYKGEPNVKYAQEITFVTGGNSATCGVSLELNEEYLLGLYRSGQNIFEPDEEGGELTVGLCDLVSVWSSVSAEDEATLEGGCGGNDLCLGNCGDSQDCLLYTDGSADEYYCADVCTPSTCGDEEVCSLEDAQCDQAPCPPVAICTDSCGGICNDSQECLLYNGGSTDEFYCADVCTPSTCGDEQVCSLVEVQCVQAPCPPTATCTDVLCGGTCLDSQECLLYTDGSADEYYCADVCTPSTCGDEEVCSLEDAQCDQAPCPLVAVCTDLCGGICDDSQECLQYQRNGKWYCSDNCANSPCAEHEQCTTKVRKWCRNSGYEGCPLRRSCL